MKADDNLQETIRRRNTRSKKLDLHADGEHAHQDVHQQGQDLPVPKDEEEMGNEDEYEGMAGMK